MIKRISRKSTEWYEKQQEKLEGLDEYEDFVEIDKIKLGIDEFPENLQEFCFNVFVEVRDHTDLSNDFVFFNTKEHKNGKDDVAQIFYKQGKDSGEPDIIFEIVGDNKCVKKLTFHHQTYENDIVLHNLDFKDAELFIDYIFCSEDSIAYFLKLAYIAGFENGKNDKKRTTKK